MTSQSIRQSGYYSGFASTPANPERRSRLFTQVRRYSGILGPSSSAPTQSQQSQIQRQPAEPVVPTLTAENPSDTAEERFINAVLGLGDIISASCQSTTKVQKVKEPDTFDGTDSSKLDEWITQVTLYFTANLAVYESDEDKVIFGLSYLRGQASAWFQPDLLGGLSDDEPEPAWASDFVAFINELVVNFGPHDPEGTAESRLELLQMKESDHITKFLVKFNLEAGRTRWGDAALRRQFYKALPNRIKDLMTKDGKPATLALMKQKAQEYDA